MSVFRGQYYHTIDEKGRIVLPAKLRGVFKEKNDKRLVITSLDNYLLVLPYDEWNIIEEKAKQHSILKKEIRAFQRYFMSGAVDCTLDPQWRVLIPPSLRVRAKLEKDIVLAGMVKTIEIWDRTRFEEDLSASGQNTDNFIDNVADLLGI
ncbi:MAG: division/cell wall cluster transcriptional repressor MraZ [Syntrophobacterales bacterium]|nr:division/cell wall cluster transcriptional repressor MraZ [Syntrophobacterales bacterium]